ncbi:hypothetical protein ASF60_18935 [Methylobacterium sp. Leaf113]|nr:hypothetical protein ASF60_18935 [Methylobacterium sp. Leaf113]
MALQQGDPAALTARITTAAADHLGRGARLIKENQAILIEVGLMLELVLARGPHVGSRLLSRGDSRFNG